MRFTQIPPNTFKQLQLNAGILLPDFDPSDGSFSMADILGATSGGINFTANAEFIDFADDVDNARKNMKEFKVLDEWTATMSGTFVSMTPALAKILVGAGIIDANDATNVVPRNDLDQEDFIDLWWVGDYSDKTGATHGGFLAIHLMNALSTGGFQIQSGDKAKGQFSFEFTGHYSSEAPDTVPFEIYTQAGTAESGTTPEILLDKHSASVAVGSKIKLKLVRVEPSGSAVTWSSSATGKASVSNGEVTGVEAGSAIITASITVDGVSYTDTCTVTVKSA